MKFEQFASFLEGNRYVLWSLENIQTKIMDANLGRKYWSKKVEQYRVVREQENLVLL